MQSENYQADYKIIQIIPIYQKIFAYYEPEQEGADIASEPIIATAILEDGRGKTRIGLIASFTDGVKVADDHFRFLGFSPYYPAPQWVTDKYHNMLEKRHRFYEEQERKRAERIEKREKKKNHPSNSPAPNNQDNPLHDQHADQ